MRSLSRISVTVALLLTPFWLVGCGTKDLEKREELGASTLPPGLAGVWAEATYTLIDGTNVESRIRISPGKFELRNHCYFGDDQETWAGATVAAAYSAAEITLLADHSNDKTFHGRTCAGTIAAGVMQFTLEEDGTKLTLNRRGAIGVYYRVP